MIVLYPPTHSLHATDQVMVDGKQVIIEEVPQRVDIILDTLQKAGHSPFLHPQDYGETPLLDVHDSDYLHYLKTIYTESARYYGEPAPVFPETFAPRSARRKSSHPIGLKGYYAYGIGSPILEGTWTASYWSAQCALSAADYVRTQANAGNIRCAYALCRPPGHHAGPDFYGGFCYLNNAAAAARFLSSRTAILDIDYHHGNGTQEIFYSDPQVLFCSIHAHPDQDYPFFWGAENEVGDGPGKGYNRNWPLPLNTGEEVYLETLSETLALIRDFSPEYLVVSAGFDTVKGDPAGGFNLTTRSLAEIGVRIGSLHLPSVIVQEGGYLLDSLGANAAAFLTGFDWTKSL